MTRAISTALAMALMASAAFGQDVLHSTGSTPIREQPPAGPLGRPGAQVGTTAEATDYVIVREHAVQSGIGRSQLWIQIAPSNAGPPLGWVYFGDTADATSRNFERR